MTYDDNVELFKFSENFFTKTVCPFGVPMNVDQSKSFTIPYDDKSSMRFIEAANKFFVDDEFCPI